MQVLFCEWLTACEQKMGLIGRSERYRLPTDQEWSYAVGIGTQERSAAGSLKDAESLPATYPWGKEWPPPKRAGNFADETFATELGVYTIP